MNLHYVQETLRVLELCLVNQDFLDKFQIKTQFKFLPILLQKGFFQQVWFYFPRMSHLPNFHDSIIIRKMLFLGSCLPHKMLLAYFNMLCMYHENCGISGGLRGQWSWDVRRQWFKLTIVNPIYLHILQMIPLFMQKDTLNIVIKTMINPIRIPVTAPINTASDTQSNLRCFWWNPMSSLLLTDEEEDIQ